MNSVEYMLTTVDNPFNPFTDFEAWFGFDTAKGYNSCGYLARIAKTSDGLSELDYQEAVNSAIDEILANDFRGIYRKVKESDKVVAIALPEESDETEIED